MQQGEDHPVVRAANQEAENAAANVTQAEHARLEHFLEDNPDRLGRARRVRVGEAATTDPPAPTADERARLERFLRDDDDAGHRPQAHIRALLRAPAHESKDDEDGKEDDSDMPSVAARLRTAVRARKAPEGKHADEDDDARAATPALDDNPYGGDGGEEAHYDTSRYDLGKGLPPKPRRERRPHPPGSPAHQLVQLKKRIMQERGVDWIKAGKIVAAEGLWTKGGKRH